MASDPAGESTDESRPDLRSALGIVRRLATLHKSHRTTAYELSLQDLLSVDLGGDEAAAGSRALGRARKVSVSLPEELTMVLQQRLEKGEFSQYVTEAVARQLELDLLAELSDRLEAEHGPIPEEFVAEARGAWPDAE